MLRRFTAIIALVLLNTACQDGHVNAACAEGGVTDESLQNLSDSSASPQTPAIDIPTLLNQETRRWIISFKQKVEPTDETKNTYRVRQLNVDGDIIDKNAVSVSIDHVQDRMQALEGLLQDNEVSTVEPDHVLKTMDMDIDASAITPTQWPHIKIDTSQAWKYTQGSPDIVVAVIDGGVDFNHPELRTQKWVNPRESRNGRDDDGNGLVDDIHGWDYVQGDNDPIPTSTASSAHHGTHVAGIIAGAENYSKGYAGVAPGAKIMALRFLDNNKSGYTSNAVKAINYAVDKGVKVINLSWGSYNRNTSLMNALKRAESRGVLIVAAAGNYGNNNNTKPFYPASYGYSNIISVTASSQSDSWVSGINYGTRAVHIAAPGSGIVSTDRNNSYRSRGGSSMAAPFVAGAAALLLSADPGLKAPQLKNLILGKAERISKLTSRVASGRRVNAATSMRALAGGNYSDTPIGATPQEFCESPDVENLN